MVGLLSTHHARPTHEISDDAHRVQAWSERRAARCLRHGSDNARPAGRTAHSQTAMMRDKGPDLGHVDPLVHADRLGRKIAGQRRQTAWTKVGPVLDDRIRRLAHHPAVALVAGLGSARLRALALLLAVG